MWNITLQNIQFRSRQFLIAVIGTALVFGMALLVTGVREGFYTEAQTHARWHRRRLLGRPERCDGSLHGQQQRGGIARALVHRPPLLVADEPTAHLDYIQVEEILRIMRDLATPGRLVVIATHDERIIPLADGTIELVPKGTPAERPPQRLTLEAGQILFTQGSPSDFVYIVDEGEIELQREAMGPAVEGGR